jgi:protein-tyrosine phosphatase
LIPLVDTHCHLLAGLDDGPRTAAESLRMCEMLVAEGVQFSVALAHQNPQYPEVTPERIRESAGELASQLRDRKLGLTVFPCAEVMLQPDTESMWRDARLMTVGDHGQYLLIEMPHGHFVDLRPLARKMTAEGIRPIVAHAERYSELLHTRGLVETWIEAGCLIQVCTSGVVGERRRADRKIVQSWFRRGIVHVFGSDGHSPDRRPPLIKAAYHEIVAWAGTAIADRVCSTNGMTILQGLPLRVPPPKSDSWVARLWG